MKNRFLTLAAILLAATACQEKLAEEDFRRDALQMRSQKIINEVRYALTDRITVFVEKGSEPDFSAIKGVVSYEKVFPTTPGKEEMEAKHGLDRWYLLHLDGKENIETTAESIAGLDAVEYVQFSYEISASYEGTSYPYRDASTKATSTTWCPYNDPMVSAQWHYFNTGDLSVSPTAKAGADINVKDAWRFCAGDPSIIVAVLDEGVKYDHPDLIANIWTNADEIPGNGIDDDGNGYIDDIHGYNFKADGPISWGRPRDSGHGTHVAGTIAAVNDNGTGVCGIAGGNSEHSGVKIMSCQILDNKTSCSDAQTARAFKYAADKGASIAQCSWGYDAGVFSNDEDYRRNNRLMVDAINYFLDMDNCPNLTGSVIVFAAGNDGSNLPSYPAAYYKNISVSSIASDNLPTYYTNYGPGVNIAAPGGEYYTGGSFHETGAVLSTLPYENSDTGYGYMQGTSMACPHVVGVAALGLSYMIKRGLYMSNNEFMSKLLTSVNDIDNLLTGEKFTLVNQNYGMLSLSPYRKNMGTGTIDAWRFFMQLDGNPCLTVTTGKSQRLDLSSYFGGCSANLTYLEVSMSEEDMTAMGITEKPEISYGKLKIFPTRPGCGVVHIKAIAGGDYLGTGGNDVGGMELNRTVSIIARQAVSENGGWL